MIFSMTHMDHRCCGKTNTQHEIRNMKYEIKSGLFKNILYIKYNEIKSTLISQQRLQRNENVSSHDDAEIMKLGRLINIAATSCTP